MHHAEAKRGAKSCSKRTFAMIHSSGIGTRLPKATVRAAMSPPICVLASKRSWYVTTCWSSTWMDGTRWMTWSL